MTYPSSTLHELYLFLINLHYSSIGIRLPFISNHKTIRQRSYLIWIPNTCHWTSLWYNVLEVFNIIVNFLCRQRVFVALFYSSHFIGNSPMHVIWSFLI